MDEIRPWLFIGNYRDTANMSSLAQKSINAILQLAIDVASANRRNLVIVYWWHVLWESIVQAHFVQPH
jgi:hypothetical protein